ncbi:MAG: DUF3943 domain-containing protein [Elusimicrobiota bacterium]
MRAHALPPAGKTPPDVGILQAETRASSTTPDNVGPTSPDRVLPGEPVKRKNYFIPALEIPLFQSALNGVDRLIYGETDYGSTWNSGWRHVRRGPWVVDQDDFAINQLGHPYQGSMYYGFARASGLNFWEGLIYSNVGSFIWETYGETTDPSINDQVASGTGGPFIGEPLFRMANLVLEGGEGPPGFWRELGAGFISPPTALNRLLFGERYTPILKSRNAATFTQVQAGASVNSTVRNPRSADEVGRNAAVGNFAMAYGLPGQPGYLYLRPFDYFTFELNGLRENHTDFYNIMTRGLLFGQKYESGDDYQGVWGLYGSYDYLSPQVFRFSTTAASLGTTFQWRLSQKVALQGTALGGIGYGTAGTIVPLGDEKDFHYGAAPQGLLALRCIFGKLAMLDATARGYYLSGVGSSRAHGVEELARLNASFIVRIYGPHALGINYLLTSREARYSSASLPARHQLVETIGLAYNLIGDIHFGAVNWERN